MDWYRITLRLATPTLSAWQADTIFGHVCWALAHTEGPEFLENFLGLYGLDAPPLVLSNGFPGDLLPRPLLMARPEPRDAGLAEAREAYRRSKDVRKALWLSTEEFERVRRGETLLPEARQPLKERVSMHSQINRSTGTTGPEGTLFALEETVLAEEFGGRITVYALVDPGFAAGLGRCLAYLEATGYGKRKSAGYGAIAEAKLERFDGFPPVDGQNGFVSLSNFVPAAGDPAEGAWSTLVKRGKLGEEYATARNPFKRPVLMLVAGSCFYDRALRPYYGRLVPNVHPDFPEVVQYGLALPVGMRLPDTEAPD
mgnify:CR=1 FL=1